MELKLIQQQLSAGRSIYDLPLRVAYYARVSTERDQQLNSLENQITYYKDFIRNNANWKFAGGYVDEGISGTSTLKRENFLRMIDDAEAGHFDLIVTKEISRFARDTLDSIQYTRRLLEVGVGVFFQSDNINTLNSDAELRLTIMASLAQDEVRRLSERVKFGMQRAYEAGRVLGNENIYGYRKEKGKLIIDEEQAALVRTLFTIYDEGKYGFRTIARVLGEMGFTNQSGKPLNPGTLRQILENPKYKGYYHGRLTESSDYRSKKKVKLSAEEQLYYKDENIPAIVSEELWDRVNARLAGRREKFKKHEPNTQSRFPYTGKIYCEEHGTPHYRKVWKDRKIPKESWCCKEYLAHGRTACSTPHIYTKDLDAIMEYIGRDLLDNRERYVHSVEHLINLYRQSEHSRVDRTQEVAKITAEIAKAKRKQDKLLDLYTDGDLEKADYLEKNTAIKDTLAGLNSRLGAIRTEQEIAAKAETSLEQVRAYFDEAMDNGKSALEIAQDMLERVTVLRDSTKDIIKIRINMKYGESQLATIIRTFISYSATEVAPIVGSERQSEELVHYLLQEFEENPAKIWESNIFGKSLHELVNEGLHNKLYRMPSDARMKMQETTERIINEGCSGLICIIL